METDATPRANPRRTAGLLLYVLIAAAGMYLFSHREALTNPYVINDDVRQQIYWMQQWNDPALYENDLLTAYAKNYVPWGVKAVYAIAAPVVDPLRFSEVLGGVLYVIAAGFVFGMGLRLRDELTAVFSAAAFCLSRSCMLKISGGLSQSFGIPLLAAYLFFLGGENLLASSLIILLASVFNPYIFLICLVTHGIFLVHRHGPALMRALFRKTETWEGPGAPDLWPLVWANIPVVAGVVLMAMKYVFFKATMFGDLVTRADMAGKLEYTAAGRYQILPVPSLLTEFVRPWRYDFGQNAALVSILFLGFLLLAWWVWRRRGGPDLKGLKVFVYLWPASLILFLVADLLLMRLFLPRRYVEFSLVVFNCVLAGAGLAVLVPALVGRRRAIPLVATVLFLFAAMKMNHVGTYDYSKHADLYRFFRTTPPITLAAGHPVIMDNVLVFGRRRAFVTFELSHTWYKDYWKTVKTRTFDLFRAYYARDPERVREFCRKNGIRFLVVREEDFSPEKIRSGGLYFEPFGGFIKKLAGSGGRFAVLDEREFPPVFREKGIRVIEPM